MIFEGICKLLCEIKISELGFFGYKVTSIANIVVYRLHKGNTNFQLEVSENKDIYFLFNFIDPSKTYLRTLESLWTPG